MPHVFMYQDWHPAVHLQPVLALVHCLLQVMLPPLGLHTAQELLAEVI